MYTIFLTTVFIILQYFTNSDAFVVNKIKSIDKNEFPFVVSIHPTEKNHICGGALISYKHILTSEHCVFNQRARNLQVSIGSDDLYSAKNYKVESIMRFDDWTKRHHSATYPNNDVAILSLESSVTDIKPGLIDETSRNIDFYGKNVVTVGWREDKDGNLSKQLQKNILQVLTPDQCNRNLFKLTGSRHEINEKYFCTDVNPYTSLAKGDEGSPIMYNNRIIGVNHGAFVKLTGDRAVVEQNLHIGLEYYRKFIRDILSYD